MVCVCVCVCFWELLNERKRFSLHFFRGGEGTWEYLKLDYDTIQLCEMSIVTLMKRCGLCKIN